MKKRLAVVTGAGAFKLGHYSRVQALLDYLSRKKRKESWLDDYELTLIIEKPNVDADWHFDSSFPKEFEVRYYGMSVSEKSRGMVLRKGMSTALGAISIGLEHFDISISSMLQGGLLSAISKRLRRTAYSIYDDMDYYPSFVDSKATSEIIRQVERFIVRTADYVASVSGPLSTLRRNQGATNVSVCPNGVSPELFQGAFESNTKRRPDKFVLLYSGSLDPGIWGLSIILEAMVELRKKMDIELRIVGGGPFKSRLESLARSLHILDSVQFIGAVNHADLPSCFSGVHAGFAIGLAGSAAVKADPIKVKEYIAAGIPFVGTYMPSIEQIYDESHFGILCQDSVSSVVEAVTTLRRNYEEIEKHANNARKFIVDNYSWDSVFDRLFAAALGKVLE